MKNICCKIWHSVSLTLYIEQRQLIRDIFMAKKDLFKICTACATRNVDLIPLEAQGPLHWVCRQMVQEDMPPGLFSIVSLK